MAIIVKKNIRPVETTVNENTTIIVRKKLRTNVDVVEEPIKHEIIKKKLVRGHRD